MLSGNCGPAALGCVAGLRNASAVYWFDAHGDFNTPDTTVGGFLDGMAMATMTGRCWPALAAAIPGFAPLAESCVTLLGARDLDPLEAAALEASDVRLVPPADLRTGLRIGDRGLRAPAAGPAYLHLDLDVMDPSEGRVNMLRRAGGTIAAGCRVGRRHDSGRHAARSGRTDGPRSGRRSRGPSR